MPRIPPLLIVLALAPLLSGCFALAATGVAAAGVGTALMADDRRTTGIDDRRTTGIYVEEENIEWKSLSRISRQFSAAHVNTTSFNRRVLLTGEAPSEEMKKAIEEAVRSLENVREVTNEIVVSGNASVTSRGNDSLITSNVKTRMLGNGLFSPNHVKVVTEAGSVFLMGLVTPAEGDAAVEVARSTSGVSRVVKVFEYLPASAPKN